MTDPYKVTVDKQAWLIVVASGLLVTGCSYGLEGVGAGATSGDDAARCAALASEMGLDLQTHPTTHFLLMSTAGTAADHTTGRFLDQVAEQFVTSFARAGFALTPLPDKLICVCLDSYEELDGYGRKADWVQASWMDGYYSYRTNRVAFVRTLMARKTPGKDPARSSAAGAFYAYPSGEPAPTDGLNLTTTTHEIAHQLAFNCGLQRRDVTYPFWLTEGLAANFEADSSGSYGLGQQASRYRGRLAEVRARGRLMPMEQFAGMIDAPAGGGQVLRDAYAQAWGLFAYLLHHRREQLRSYMSGLAASPSGHRDAHSLRRRFMEAFGPIETLEREFARTIDAWADGRTP